MIEEFKDENSWLSNMYPFEEPFITMGFSYRTNEHFYVAMKATDIETRKQVTEIISPYEVRKFGKTFTVRGNWNESRLSFMLGGLRYKFSRYNPILRQKLIDTGDQYLQEGNTWGDSFWGYCFIDEFGHNYLGKLLMMVRSEIQTLDNLQSISTIDIPAEYTKLVNENFWELM